MIDNTNLIPSIPTNTRAIRVPIEIIYVHSILYLKIVSD